MTPQEKKAVSIGIIVIVVGLFVLQSMTPDIYVEDGMVIQIDGEEIYPRPVTKTDYLEGNVVEVK